VGPPIPTIQTARLIGRPVDDRDLEVGEVGGVVRDERCSKPPRERSDQQVSVVVAPPVSPPVGPESRCLHPHCPVIVDPLKRADEGVQIFQLTIRPAVTQAARQLVEDDWAHEEVVIVISRLAKTRERRGIPAENLAKDIRVEDEARHSGVDGPQAHAGATQQGVKVLPPLLAAIIGLGRGPHEPPPERLVLPADTTSARALSP